MKCIYFSFCFPLLSLAQTAEPQTRLLGPVSDGSLTTSVAKSEPPVFQVESSRTVRLPDRNLTIRKVQPPVLNLATPQLVSEDLSEIVVDSDIDESALLFVSAHVYQKRRTHLTWWMEGQEYSAWTDIDFHNFSGITSFTHKNRLYDLIMCIGGDDTMPVDDWKPSTPGSFLLPQEDMDNPKALDVVEAFASLYALEKDTLIAARLGREEAARKAALEPPKPPADIVLHIWDKPSRPLTLSEKAHRDATKEDGK